MVIEVFVLRRTTKRYEVERAYLSGLGGPWLRGDLVDLLPERAEAVDRDSPDTLTLADTQQAETFETTAYIQRDRVGGGYGLSSVQWSDRAIAEGLRRGDLEIAEAPAQHGPSSSAGAMTRDNTVLARDGAPGTEFSGPEVRPRRWS